MNKSKPLYVEEQAFRVIWFWLIVGAALMYAPIALTVELVGTESGSDGWWEALYGLLFSLYVSISISAWLLWLKMTTTVRPDGLFLYYRGLYWKDISVSLDEVESVEAKEYRPILGYGGWGIRYVWKGKAYNVSGNEGVRIHYKNGKHILIGSQEPKKLLKAIQQILPETS